MTRQQRKSWMNKKWSRDNAVVNNTAVSETNAAQCRAYPGVEHHAESSRVAESRGPIEDGFLLDFNNLVSNSDQTNRNTIWQNDQHTGFVGGFDETMADPTADGDGPSTNLSPHVTHGPQETNMDAIALAPSDIPRLEISNSLGNLYEDLAHTILNYVPTQQNVPLVSPRDDQQPATPRQTLTGAIGSLNIGADTTQTVNTPTHIRNYAITPDNIAPSDLPTTFFHPSDPFNQTIANPRDPLPWNVAPSQLPVYPPSLNTSDTVQPYVVSDRTLYPTADWPVESAEEAEQILRRCGVWPE
ncbi:hypothetical protein MMC22_004578 [Lobaria immixta]|nr:hypothetical protein [Lobaria immixta]